MRRLDDPWEWSLIDWDDAAIPSTKGALHLNRNTHSPKVFIDMHGPEVDIWGVGSLVLCCDLFGISPKLLSIGR